MRTRKLIDISSPK